MEFSEKMMIYKERKLDGTLTWVLFLFLGWFYGSFEQYLKQILYYITLCGFGLWWIYVLFTLSSKIREHNRKVAIEIGFTGNELYRIGL